MFDWQTIAVALIILAAFAYAARRGLARLRSFRPSNSKGSTGCSTGCGSCGEASAKTQPATPLVQITNSILSRRDSRK